MSDKNDEGPVEIAIVGDLTDNETELSDKLLSVDPGDECILYFDSPGGDPYTAMSLMTLMLLRGIRATGIVTGECSSAAVWPFAACARRIVTPYSVLLFHSMKWQSEENVDPNQAAEWARHFGDLEKNMDTLLAALLGTGVETLEAWSSSGRYMSGPEIASAGMAELIDYEGLRKRSDNGDLLGLVPSKSAR